ncbi:MAG TPA: NfeD family protein [Xanthobacteraceae bacterium]|nr:NfeD family protein [Xanthobacteraceae bacterium]
MIEHIVALGAWSWIILGGILLAIEVMAPGTFILWLGLSAILVGAISFAINWGWQEQGVAFAILAVASVALWWRFGRRDRQEPGDDQPFLNRRAQGFVGRVFTLEKPIVDGSGTVRIGDTIWRVTGPDCAAGSRVKIVRAEGATLFVEPQ